MPGYSIGNMHVCGQADSARSVCKNALIRTSVSLFGSECPLQCPDMSLCLSRCTVVCRHTYLDRIRFALSLWISVVVIGYIITHCTCICQSLDSCFFLCFFFQCLYCPWLKFYRYLFWSVFVTLSFLPFFFFCFVVNVSIRVRLYCHCLDV